MFKNFFSQIIISLLFLQNYYSLRSNCDLATDYSVSQSQATLLGDAHTVQGPMTNEAIEFDGDEDYAQFLPSATFGGGVISISYQVKWFSTSSTSYSRIIDCRKNQKKDNLVITQVGSTTGFQVITRSADESYQLKIANNIITDNQWEHYLIIFKQGNIIIIKDNVEITTDTSSTYQNNDGVLGVQRDVCYLGKSNWSGDDYFYGQLDEFTIYDYEVTTEQRECIFDICNVVYCSKCSGASNVCGICNGNREIPNCDCPAGYQDTNQDICCSNQCIQCTGSASNCDSCKGDRLNPPNCVCPDKYYDDGVSTMCTQCTYDACETCSQAGSCDTCYGSIGLDSSRLAQDCSCPLGYYSDLDSQEECIKCDISCNECDINGCTNCVNNRIKDTTPSQEQQCICDSDSVDHFITHNTYWCTTCTVAVITVKFSNDYNKIIVQFYVDISIPQYEDNSEQQSGTISLCQFVFEQDILNSLGQNSKCRLDSGLQQFQIFLGQQPTIKNGIDQITFKQNVIQRTGCLTSQFLNEFKENILQLGDIPLPPTSELILPTSKVTLCQQIEIQFINIINDGLRGLKNLIWSIDSTDSTDTQQIQDLLDNQNLNNNKAMFLNIPMLTLQEYKTYQMQVQYENFAGIIGINKFTIETLSTTGTYVQIQQTKPFVFKNWKQNELIADINYLDCKSGTLQYIDKSLQVDWVDITSNPNNSTPLLTQNTEPKEKISIYQIEKYSSKPGQTYTIEIRVNIPGEPLMASKQFVKYSIEVNELLVYIEGGNRLQAYSNELDLQGYAQDIDVPVDQQKDGISLDWDCINIMDQEQCKNIGGAEIPLGTSESLHYEKKIFEPYTSYLFTLTGDNGVKSNTGQAIIIVVETDLPVLTVSIPQQVRNQKINKNDDLQMQIDLSQDPDEVFYSLIIIYKFEVVATKSYNYNIFAFQIWDIYNDFQSDESEFIFRVSVYNPQYFMPSQSSFTTNINFPPLAGKVTISPTTGIALDTKFSILCEDFYDEDQPLTYKYSYYTQVNHYQKEILQGGRQISVYKNLLYDFTNQNIFETTLPSGLNDDILLLVTVQDSLGGITNITETIQVQKYSEDISQNLERFETLYDQSQSLDQQLKLSSINLFVQEMGQIFLSDDGLAYSKTIEDQSLKQQFLEFKKSVYDDLINYVGNIFSKVLEDQVLESINILQNVGGNLAELQNEEEIDNQINQINDVILTQQQTLNELIAQNMINQGDNSVTKKQNSINEILGKSMQFMDQLSINLSQKIEDQRVLQQEEQINQQQQIYESTKLLQNTIQLAMLPNSDQISFYGENISQEVQVLTQKQLQNKYFEQESQGLSLFNQRYTSNQDQLNLDTKKGQIYKTSGSAFKSNPFLNDKGFPYKDQDTLVLDIDLIEDGEDTDEEIQIQKQEISMFFDSIEYKEDSKNACIQKKKGDLEQMWDFKTCQTEESEEDYQIQCKCKSLTPVTIIDDIDNILDNNKIEEAYDDQGLKALSTFSFWKSVIFYIYICKCIGITLSIYYGYQKDLQDKKDLELQKQQQLDNLSQKSQSKQKENLEQQLQEENKLKQEVNSKSQIQEIQNQEKKEEQQQNKNNNNNNNYDDLSFQKQSSNVSVKQNESVQIQINNQTNNLINQKIFNSSDNSLNEESQVKENNELKNSERQIFNKGKQQRLKQQKQNFENQLNSNNQAKNIQLNLKDIQQSQENNDTDLDLSVQEKQQENQKQYQQQQDNNLMQGQSILTNSPKNYKNFNFSEEDSIVQNQDYVELKNSSVQKRKNELNLQDVQQNNEDNNINLDQKEKVKLQENKCQQSQNQQDLDKQSYSSQRQLQQKNSSCQLLSSTQKQSFKVYNFDDNQGQMNKNGDQHQQQIFQLPTQLDQDQDNSPSLQNLNNENSNNEECKEIKKLPSEALFVFHSYFGIYLLYNQELSRPVRYILYFIRINLLIVISALFSQGTTQFQSLLLSVLTSLVLALPCAILQALLKSKNNILIIIGYFLYVSIFSVALYGVLTTAALMGVDKSNQWTISYVSAFSIDIFCLEIIKGYLKVFILKTKLFKNKTKLVKQFIGDENIYNYLTQK